MEEYQGVAFLLLLDSPVSQSVSPKKPPTLLLRTEILFERLYWEWFREEMAAPSSTPLLFMGASQRLTLGYKKL